MTALLCAGRGPQVHQGIQGIPSEPGARLEWTLEPPGVERIGLLLVDGQAARWLEEPWQLHVGPQRSHVSSSAQGYQHFDHRSLGDDFHSFGGLQLEHRIQMDPR